MKDLEKIIKENRTVFDSQEPSDGHLERFRSRLQKNSNGAKSIRLPYFLRVASVLILVVLSSLWIFDRFVSTSPETNGYGLSEILPEFRDVEIYYTTLISTKYKELNGYTFATDTTAKNILLYELNQMDSIQKQFEKELKLNPRDPRIINAFIEHYEVKLEVMNHILNQLQQINTDINLNNNDHENAKI
jgi:hypothetical protein